MKKLVVAAALAALVCTSASAATLDTIKQRGTVNCGTAPNLPGFAYTDDKNVRRGFDVDLCRALAAAVLGDADKVQLSPLNLRDGFATLTTGGVDVLTHRLTWTYNRDNGTGLDFVLTIYYDGQGFMVPKAMNVKSVNDLKGASICVAQGSTTELNIADYFRSRKMDYRIVTFADLDEARNAYEQGRCDAWTNDRSALAARGLQLKNRDAHVILPEIISKEPIGPIVRQNDSQWAHIVRWTFFALIAAEELGVTQANVDEMKKSEVPEVKRLLGIGDDLGQKNGLPADWAYKAIKQVGNYGGHLRAPSRRRHAAWPGSRAEPAVEGRRVVDLTTVPVRRAVGAMAIDILRPPRRSRFALPQGSLAWRAFAIQAVVLVLIAAFLGWVAANVVANITRLNINTGFSFLSRPAGFEIAQKLIDFGEAATYFDVFLIALLNTVVLTAIAIVFATLLGFVIGLARLSSNPARRRRRGGLRGDHPQYPAAAAVVLLVLRGAAPAARPAPEPEFFRRRILQQARAVSALSDI